MMEIVIFPEMLAAGVEALEEGKRDCLTDGEIVLEVYLAMYLYGVKALNHGEEVLH